MYTCMKLTKLFSEERAVSPVIGVILMVAITVILAAVIATFVLGLGDSVSDTGPSSSFSSTIDGEGEDANVTVTLTSGSSIDFDELVLRGSGMSGDFDEFDEIDGIDDGDSWSVGQSVTFEGGDGEGEVEFIDAGGDVNIVWEESGGSGSSTLYTFTVPGE